MGKLSRRERERVERRTDILDAAERIFTDKGFASTTMDEVATAAEFGKGTLYLYFKNKDELYVATCLRTLERLVERYEAVAGTDDNGAETLRALGHAYVDFARDNREQFRLGMSWLLSDFAIDPETDNYDTYRSLIQRLFGISVAAMERGKRDGSIRDDLDTQRFALQTWGGTLGMLLLSINREEVMRRLQRDVDFDDLVLSFIDLMVDGIKREPNR
jgi:AcrR family transcriptional regulator